MLDYKLIEALAMVVQEGGFDRAAQKLNLTQSAVSQRIKLLEEQTGQILLARTNPPRPNPAGRRLVKHYLQVKRLEDDLFDALSPSDQNRFVVMAVGINGDSLATWFLEAVRDFLSREQVLLDLRSDDQEQTHRLLKDGEVLGCISVKDQAIQGCRLEYLGRMDYRMLATPAFAARWFPDGFQAESVRQAPLVIFNRRDELHLQYFNRALGHVPTPLPGHYLPSSERFVDFIGSGLAYGMLPDQQSATLLAAGHLVDLWPACHVPVRLYWHCWNLKSRLLDGFTGHLVRRARSILPA
jgi:LysR family transcriptional regulator (chromosome initiation inhibitor)